MKGRYVALRKITFRFDSSASQDCAWVGAVGYVGYNVHDLGLAPSGIGRSCPRRPVRGTPSGAPPTDAAKVSEGMNNGEMACCSRSSHTKLKIIPCRSFPRPTMAQIARVSSVLDMTDITPTHTAAEMSDIRHHTQHPKSRICSRRLPEAYQLQSFCAISS